MESGSHELDITFVKGKEKRPLAVFIHGIGMDKHIWTDPEKSRVLAGRFPVNVLLGKKPPKKTFHKKPKDIKRITTGIPPTDLRTLFHILSETGFHVLAWSQKRPASKAGLALKELTRILQKYVRFTRNGIILIGHSRGGLIGRCYALRSPENVRAVISFASPFKGSSLAKWADIVSKALPVVSPLFRRSHKDTVRNAIKNAIDFINSTAVKELLPGSDFLSYLKTPLSPGIKSLYIAGSSPTLFNVYSRHINCFTNGSILKYESIPKLLFSFPDSLHALLPDMLTPDELKDGEGDGLVSKKSAVLDDADDAGVYHRNHAGVLFADKAREKTVSFIEKVTGLSC